MHTAPANLLPGRITAMPFLDLLPEQRIRTDLVPADKGALFESLATLLAGDDCDHGAILESLLAREQLGSTALGRGVAIPHGRIGALEQARAAFVRLSRPLPFDAPDGHPVDLVAALVVPLHYTDQHLHVLAELAGVFSDAELSARLRAAASPGVLHAELAESRRHQNKAEAWTD